MEVSEQLDTPAAALPGTHWIGGFVAPRDSLDVLEKRKIEPRIVQPVAE
jgi:hypothetical protein